MKWLIYTVLLAAIFVMPLASAIPESDLYYFRASSRDVFQFDEYYNGSAGRISTIKSFVNATSYYLVIRANIGDSSPYDKFDVTFRCSDDATSTVLKTTDYNSWVASGQISFKRSFSATPVIYSYEGNNFSVKEAQCEIISASGLVADGNSAYTMFNIELVPLLPTTVVTVESFCEDEARRELIGQIVSGLGSVTEINVNILYTLWIVFQILLFVFAIIGIPTILTLMFIWVVHKVTGKRPFAKEERNV